MIAGGSSNYVNIWDISKEMLSDSYNVTDKITHITTLNINEHLLGTDKGCLILNDRRKRGNDIFMKPNIQYGSVCTFLNIDRWNNGYIKR